MSTVSFSQTSLPPLVRVSNSADAPFSVAAGTQPEPNALRVSVIGVHPVPRETQFLPQPEVLVAARRGRRRKS